MAKISNIVWSRLAHKTQEQAAVHPDANLLAAFAERALLERERMAVSAHLAQCADCREYLAVAFAAEEFQPPAVARDSTRAGWFHEWRWIASAAAACCIVAVALQYYVEPPTRLSSISSKAAESIAPPVPFAPARKQKVELPPSPKPAAPPVLAVKKDVTPQEATATEPATSAPPAQQLATLPTEASKTDAVSSFVEPVPQAEGRNSPPEQALSSISVERPAVRGSKSGTISGLAAGRALNVTGRQIFGLKSRTPESSRELWSINASPDMAGNSRGVVQRSTDAGQSWQIVPLSEHTSFRAVATEGADVWAGGSEGTLFHSTDGGSNWSKIQIAAGNAKLSDDIVRIDVRSPSQVSITTTLGQLWTSVDGGAHWKHD